MARISPTARRLAKARRAFAQDELGSVVSDLLPIAGTALGGPVGGAIGAALGGAMGGGSGSSSTATPAASPPAHRAARHASPPSHEEVRSIVRDALGAQAATELRAQAQDRTTAQAARATSDTVTAALAPTVRRARGGVQVQRLQAQASAEHAAIMRREAREREARTRYDAQMALLNRVLTAVGKVQARLAGRTALVQGSAIDVLGGDGMVRPL